MKRHYDPPRYFDDMNPREAAAYYSERLVGIQATTRKAFEIELIDRIYREFIATSTMVVRLCVDYEPIGILEDTLCAVGIPYTNNGTPFGFTKSVVRVTLRGAGSDRSRLVAI